MPLLLLYMNASCPLCITMCTVYCCHAPLAAPRRMKYYVPFGCAACCLSGCPTKTLPHRISKVLHAQRLLLHHKFLTKYIFLPYVPLQGHHTHSRLLSHQQLEEPALVRPTRGNASYEEEGRRRFLQGRRGGPYPRQGAAATTMPRRGASPPSQHHRP